MKSLSLFYLLIITILSFASCDLKGKLNKSEPPVLTKPFGELTPLKVPRSDISIGARWQQKVGPIKKGFAENLLLGTTGISDAVLTQNKDLRGGIVASIANRFNLSAKGDLQSKYKFNLTGLEILTVQDIDSLEAIEVGSSFVWEGIKLKSFSFFDRKSRKGEIETEIPTANVKVNSDLKSNNEYLHEVNGVNLFVAYRVIRFKKGKTKILSSDNIKSSITDRSTYNLGDEYSIVISLNELEQNKSHQAEFQIINVFDLKESVDNYRDSLWYGNANKMHFKDNSSHFLGSSFSENGLKLDQVKFDLLLSKDRTPPFVKGKINVVRRELLITTDENASAPGW